MLKKLVLAIAFFMVCLISTSYANTNSVELIKKKKRQKGVFFNEEFTNKSKEKNIIDFDLKDLTIHYIFSEEKNRDRDNKAFLDSVQYHTDPDQFRFLGIHKTWVKYAKRFYRSQYRVNFNQYVGLSQNPGVAMREFGDYFDSYQGDLDAQRFIKKAPWNAKEEVVFDFGHDTPFYESDIVTVTSDLKFKIDLEGVPAIRDFLTINFEEKRREFEERRTTNTLSPAFIPYDNGVVNTLKFKMRFNIKTKRFRPELKAIGFRILGVFDRRGKNPVSMSFTAKYKFQNKEGIIGINIVI
jgi:hypothetical protein